MRIPSSFTARVLGCCLLAAAPALASAQAAAPAKPAVGTAIAPAQIYGKLLALEEGEFVAAADAMPEDKFDFAPPTTYGDFKGVRTFADQVKHVAEANQYFFHDPSKPLVDDREAFAKLKTKAEIMQALKDSFVVAHTYVDGITAENAFIQTSNGTRAGSAAFGIAHMMDHYGQMVEYLRMNGIVPPASQPKK
ncbi:MAG TPA: DinB family protein [Terracidiphilus sp.]|jgi:uncharacterized damage-inducible protein DinB|nr:DinB family protein [Terracidiphilus sp.]